MNYHIYSRQNWKKLAQQVQKHISSKLLPFDKLFIAFFESRSNFTHFLKKDPFRSSIIREVNASENCSYMNVEQLPFQNTFRESTWERV